MSVIVPALNEARNLPHVLGAMPQVDEVILVDGGSVDDTVETARRLMPGIRVIQQGRRGKGNALACGFAAAKGDIIVMIDADGSTDPREIPRFVEALRRGADFAKGSRFVASGGSADITGIRRLGNKALSLFVNVLFRTRYSDLCYGYNAFWTAHLPIFGLDHTTPRPANGERLWGDGFEIETLLNLRVARAGLRVEEVASYEHERIHGVSNLNALTDGLRVLRTIMREWPRKPIPHLAVEMAAASATVAGRRHRVTASMRIRGTAAGRKHARAGARGLS
ncbi:glycosyltransferase involved in cell wall biosynthesis [Catenuloplanes nepalensis]|uniref:Glycosyltransferase involved in cell wall biosynthesis n=1 Tax=Catenuloplanes nepalensis TaxID=587533 RepID=A0ABT9N7G5_9ACTN|nr:glycosyltransferase family 2 protein [Catenuloplanes nepalensis]MDP9799645.1 glycosyltransferase involved in cell wall biosynthesis [Catenuloplanes nepalensis]